MASKQDVIDLLETALSALKNEDDSPYEFIREIEDEMSDILDQTDSLSNDLDGLGGTPLDDAPLQVDGLAKDASRIVEALERLRDRVQDVSNAHAKF